jgi:peptidoglycan/xylan/chitin deacetylase (PgdA/CDA1 family)
MSNTVPILMYHSISDAPADRRYRPYVVAPSVFARQMAILRAGGHSTLTVSGLLRAWARGRLPPRPVVVTFDDALADFHENALPILIEHRVAGTLYVPTGFVNGRSRWLASSGEAHRRMMTWPQLREAAALGIELGAHSHSHVDLDILSPSAARNEVLRSRALLEDGIGRPVESFAYPYGKHCEWLREEVRAAGFGSACAVGHALAVDGADNFAIARVAVDPHVSDKRFARWLEGRELRPAPEREPLRVTAWRVARRLRHRLALAAAALGTGLPAVVCIS